MSATQEKPTSKKEKKDTEGTKESKKKEAKTKQPQADKDTQEFVDCECRSFNNAGMIYC